jgi:desulfoferrodoxin
MAVKFYRCRYCGNVIEKVVDSKVPVVCCGEKMEELVANTVEASVEKHLPVVTKLDDCSIKVEVGSVAHPMLPEHHISLFMWRQRMVASEWISRTSQRLSSAHVAASRSQSMNTAISTVSGRLNSRHNVLRTK